MKSQTTFRKTLIPFLALALGLLAFPAPAALATSTPQLERAALGALSKLYARNSVAAEIGRRAVATLVFPDCHMVGFMASVQSGTGVLFYKNSPRAYFNLSGISFGIEAGMQKFDLVVFFEDEAALDKLYQVGGFEVGVAPTLVIIDSMFAGKLTSTSVRTGVDAFLSNQRGLMISLGLGKNKFTEYVPGE
jgi:lipid-binding SYLF domain-containing protein